jgi:hypothetical protein
MRQVFEDLTRKLESLPASDPDRPAITRMVTALGRELANKNHGTVGGCNDAQPSLAG